MAGKNRRDKRLLGYAAVVPFVNIICIFIFLKINQLCTISFDNLRRLDGTVSAGVYHQYTAPQTLVLRDTQFIV